MNNEFSQGVFYYEYSCYINNQNHLSTDDIIIHKRKQYGTIYEDGNGQYKIRFENWYKEYYLDDVIIGFDVQDDKYDLSITMFSFNENEEVYFIKRVIAYLYTKIQILEKETTQQR